MGDLLRTAGIPVGVFSIVNGDRATVEALITHPEVRAVAFVGSTAAAHSVYTTATSQGKRALCLGGAKNSVILVPDADEKIAASGVVASFTGCAGQRCMAASLMLAVGPVDHHISKIAEAAQAITPGDCLGAIIDRSAYERICNAIDIAEQNGAKVIVDGRKAKAPAGYEGGNWLGPTIIDHATPDMECAQVEIFGPVLTIVRVDSLSEALAIEARSVYGNATSVFTTSGAVARFVAERATSGMIGVNIGVPVPREPFSFGGTKQSKFGSGDITGMSAVEFWSSLKKVTTKWEETHVNATSAANWMS
jgi:malonate-semialdehyde dehydrogenase (acetylating)/methylmalonate-semialdehyde dehydrogenase